MNLRVMEKKEELGVTKEQVGVGKGKMEVGTNRFFGYKIRVVLVDTTAYSIATFTTPMVFSLPSSFSPPSLFLSPRIVELSEIVKKFRREFHFIAQAQSSVRHNPSSYPT
jgi:hypothetical protein